MAASERYFNDTNFFFKVLRTMNLLEPGRAVISLSKLFFILMMYIMVHIAITSPDQVVALVVAISGTALSVLNYGHRRNKNFEQGIGIGEVNPSNLPLESEEPVIE